MAKLTRKNLVMDDAKVKELARRRNTSESAAVREAVDYALAAAKVMAAIRELHESGGIDDVFGRLPDEQEAIAGDWPSLAFCRRCLRTLRRYSLGGRCLADQPNRLDDGACGTAARPYFR